MSEEMEHGGGPKAKTITELTVDLTIAWLRRVEGTAEGREPKEVVLAMDQFYAAVERHYRAEQGQPAAGARTEAIPASVGA